MGEEREVLDGIEADIENPWKSINARSLVAALRAVLDLHQPYDSAQTPHEIDDCTCGLPGPYPCKTVRTITDALGGGA